MKGDPFFGKMCWKKNLLLKVTDDLMEVYYSG